MLRSILLALFGLFCFACSGEPFSLQPDAEAPVPAERGRPARPKPSQPALRPPPRVALAPPGFDLMLARRQTNQLVALEGGSGNILASHSLDGPLEDLACDGARVLAVVGQPEAGGSQVRAFALGPNGFELVASSALFAPATRVAVYGAGALVLSEDMGTSWSLLGPDLEPVAPSKLLVRPSGLFVVSTRHGEQVVALDPNLFEDGQDADEIVSARFDSTWQVTRTSFEAAGRPDSRLAHQPGNDFAWVVRKQPDGITFQIGKLLAVEPNTPPWFEMRVVPGATGSLDAVVIDAEHAQLVALLSRGTKPGALALIPLIEGAPGSVTSLTGAVETSPWLSRQLLLHAGGQLSVATVSGLEELRLGANEVEQVRDFPELRAPLCAGE